MTETSGLQAGRRSGVFDSSSLDTAWMSLRGSRPPALRDLINAAGNALLAPDVPTMARFVAGKVFHNLSRPSGFYRAGDPALPWCEYLGRALEGAAIEGPVAAIASALAELHPNLRWYRSATGPFASVNFARDHAHALLVGPGGIEERDDVEVGLTVMGPFSRFPDHRRPHPSVFLAVSRAEVRVGDTDWTTCSPGAIFFVDDGSKIALRCTRDRLLLLWCQRVHRR
ncbi:hypothetical protein ABIA23_001492 [Sinorhizobium fredii]